MQHSALSVIAVLFTLASGQRLDKPPLEQSLDYLQQGLLDNLHPVPSTQQQWPAGQIPADCKSMTEQAGLSANDIQTFSVTYNDCGDPWILCRHTASPDPMVNMIDLFGRVPVHMRQWVRHMIALPDPNGGHAYNSNGNIAMFNRINGDLTVFIHETGHSLDLLGAYKDKPLSSSSNWINNYNQDTNVPDPYAQTNQIENVAQNTVVGTFNENIPGGFDTVEGNPGAIFHQYATLQTEADAAAPGNLLRPGGMCTQRLANSPVVSTQSAFSRLVGQFALGGHVAPPVDVSLSRNVKVIEPKEFDTCESCKMTWSSGEEL